jgi:hypothetical protein
METTMMLVPKKSAAETFEVRRCDQELEDWLANLPAEIQYTPAAPAKLTEAQEVLHSHRALLKMVYLTTSSALHRPQVLPANPFPSMDAELQEISRNKVRFAAVEITNIAQDLHSLDLTRYFPTTGVTVLLPAVIIHLLDIKSSDPTVRMTSLQRFYQCMRILQRLREIYASADFATSFLEAAIRKAGIQLTVAPQDVQARSSSSFDAGARVDTLTPPPDSLAQKIPDLTYPKPAVAGIARQSVDEGETLFASTPPPSDGSENGSTANINRNHHRDAFSIPNLDSELSISELMDLANDAEVTQNDFDALINFDDAGADFFTADDHMNLNGSGPNSKGFGFTMDPINGMSDLMGFDTGNKADIASLGDRQLHSDRMVTTTGHSNTETAASESNSLTANVDADLGICLSG